MSELKKCTWFSTITQIQMKTSLRCHFLNIQKYKKAVRWKKPKEITLIHGNIWQNYI